MHAVCTFALLKGKYMGVMPFSGLWVGAAIRSQTAGSIWSWFFFGCWKECLHDLQVLQTILRNRRWWGNSSRRSKLVRKFSLSYTSIRWDRVVLLTCIDGCLYWSLELWHVLVQFSESTKLEFLRCFASRHMSKLAKVGRRADRERSFGCEFSRANANSIPATTAGCVCF